MPRLCLTQSLKNNKQLIYLLGCDDLTCNQISSEYICVKSYFLEAYVVIDDFFDVKRLHRRFP